MKKKGSRTKGHKKSNNVAYVENLLGLVKDGGKKMLKLGADERIYSQGDEGNAIYFIENGKVRISVVSAVGKEATLLILGPREFFGEGCLVGHTARIGTAETLEPTTLVRVKKETLKSAIDSNPKFAQQFISMLLARNIELEEDLCDQLFNQSEKRLARALLKLARFGKDDVTPDVHISTIKHEILAEMIGTTRPRVNFFMNKFRKLGLIDYNDGLVVRAALLTDVVLSD
jgi:CRP/FNR family transcriptional regulator, cyclic AMP receptor protein